MSDQESSATKLDWTVPTGQGAIRLDSFVHRCLPHLSWRKVEDAIREKLFRINGRIGKKGDKLKSGDVLGFDGPDDWLYDRPLPDHRFEVSIVYEDDSLLALDKPAGVATHGFSALDQNTLANFLAARRPALFAVGKSRWEPGLVHRLDRETSGLVLAAKTESAFEHLRLQFRRRQVKKKYRALVWGVTEPERAVSYSIVHDSRDKRRMRALLCAAQRKKQRAWSALTRFRRLSASSRLSLLDIEMETGVTHQIRVHLAAIGHPIVGDTLYGGEGLERFGNKRHFLHAFSLKFQHPASGRSLQLEVDLPGELRDLLRRLKITC